MKKSQRKKPRLLAQKQSRLARVLERLMVTSGQSQENFARMVGVSPDTLSGWMHDRALPRPKYIKAIVNVASRFGGTERAVERFYRIVRLPAEQVTPFHRRVGYNIGCYMSSRTIEGVLRKVVKVTREWSFKKREEYVEKVVDFIFATLPK